MRFFRLLAVLCLGLALPSPAPAEDGLLISPGPGETVTDARPVVTVQLPRDGSVVSETARLWVGGREVTFSSLRTPFFVSYQPPGEMESGEVAVRFLARARQGGEVERSWTFRVQPTGRIQSVTHDATGELGEYDELQVEMKAEPGGKAWFDIEGFRERLPMEEVSDGVYRGSYQVLPGDHRLAARVVAWLRFGRQTSSMAAEKPVTLFGNLFRVKILEPANGSTVPLDFHIKGRTRPRARVSVVPKIGFDEGISAPSRTDPGGGGTTGTIPAEADEKGYFSVHYGIPIKLPSMHLVLTIVATDQEGNRSIPTVLRLKF